MYANHSYHSLRQQNLLHQSISSSSSISQGPRSDTVRSTLSALLLPNWSIGRAATAWRGVVWLNVVWLNVASRLQQYLQKEIRLWQLSPAWELQGAYRLLFLCIQESTWKQNSYIRLPVQMLHATNRVGGIRKLHTMIPTVLWSCEVKEEPVIRNTQFAHKTYTTFPSLWRKWCHVLCLPPHRTKEMVSCLVLATAPHKGNAAARILISHTPSPSPR
jgi:hypothetical protein